MKSSFSKLVNDACMRMGEAPYDDDTIRKTTNEATLKFIEIAKKLQK